ncbi:hypothetical protein DL93DRAFT_1432589 [Clavulina sp. PMI_390]|nr:hypothetical protein DL93DRAFT_1432589 [Clavulina sp. PMI_390]
MTPNVATDQNDVISIGVWLVCEILASIFFGILTVQCSFYFTNFPHDKWSLKGLVSLSWFLELFNQIFTLWWTYEIQIQNFGRIALTVDLGWTVGVLCAFMTFNSVVVQLFFARRGYLLNPSIWPFSLISVVLVALALTMGMIISIKMIVMSGDFSNHRWLKDLWALSEAAADAMVMLTVVYSLGARREIAHTNIRRGIKRLIVYTVSNGFLTSALAFMVFALFKFLPQVGAYAGVNLVLSRIYANSLLASLNLRGSWIRDQKTDGASIELTPRVDPPQQRPLTTESINEADDGLFSSPIEPQDSFHDASAFLRSIGD